jgi:small conductance mechanosensitive channel
MIIDWAQSPEGGIRWLRMLGFALLILFVTWILQRFAGGAVRRIVDRQHAMSDLLKNFAVTMAGRVVWGLGAIVALGAIGVEVGPFMAAIGAGGFIIAFAMQDSLSNLFSGVMIMIYRPFDVGDFVDIAGVAGTVQHVSLVSTGLRTGDNKLLIIPNNSIWGGIITNATGADTRRVDMTFGIGYTDDVDRALDLLKQMVEEHELVLEDPAPNIRVHELADSSVNIICRPWTKTEDYWSVFWDLQQTVKKRFDAEGISIPYPQHDVHVHQV